jgi:hypothetical protein
MKKEQRFFSSIGIEEIFGTYTMHVACGFVLGSLYRNDIYVRY